MLEPSNKTTARSTASTVGRLLIGLIALPLWVFPRNSSAFVLDMRAGSTEMSQHIQELHHISLLVCVVVGIVVFGAMFYSIFAHSRSRNPTPATFHESLTVEIIWTIIPVLILLLLAVPAVAVPPTVRVTGLKLNPAGSSLPIKLIDEIGEFVVV